MNFAKRIFFWSAVYGIVVLVPMFFLEESIGRHIPPATNRPEQYYGFIGVALAWQFAFFLIARDPLRYRPLMLAAVAEKLLPAGSVVYLFAVNRVDEATLPPFLLDLAIGLLFLVSYFRVRERWSPSTATPSKQ